VKCANCGAMVQGKSAAVRIFAESRGLKPILKARAQSLVICADCGTKLGAGEKPSAAFVRAFAEVLLPMVRLVAPRDASEALAAASGESTR
jgi:hypothetical protein